MVSPRIQKLTPVLEHIIYNDPEFILDKVKSFIIPPANPETDDWIWIGPVDSKGQAYLYYKGGPNKRARKVYIKQLLWMLYYGTIDERYLVMACRGKHNFVCVNPYHVSVGPFGAYRKTTMHNGSAVS